MTMTIDPMPWNVLRASTISGNGSFGEHYLPHTEQLFFQILFEISVP